MKSWVKEINLTCEKQMVYVIAGNKMDLVENPSLEEARAFADSIHGIYIETSAKTGKNLDEMLAIVARGEPNGRWVTHSSFREVERNARE